MNDNNKKVYDILNSLDKEKNNEKTQRIPSGAVHKKTEIPRQSSNNNNNNAPRRTAEESRPQNRRNVYDIEKSTSKQSSAAQKSSPAGSKNGSGKKRKKKKKNHLFKPLVLLLIIVVISAILSAVIIYFGREMLGIGKDDKTIVVTVPDGATVTEISEILKDENIIKTPRFFVLFSKLNKTDTLFKSGEHEVRADMAYETLLNALISDPISDENSVTLTFIEGVTISEAAEMLEVGEVCSADDFIEAFNKSPEFGLEYEKHMPTFSSSMKFYRMEGYLFPDTYTFYKNMAPDLVCQRILENFDKKITDDMYDKMDRLGISLDETMIFASIVQKEAGTVGDMPIVSSVFWNRLNHSDTYPRLQSDTTNTYIEDIIKPHIDEINQEMFDAYDTYTCTGLPVGAVCNPGLDAISAVLDPDDTKYYFFYSDKKTKETFFAEDYEQHLANIEKVNRKYGIIDETDISSETNTDTSGELSDE